MKGAGISGTGRAGLIAATLAVGLGSAHTVLAEDEEGIRIGATRLQPGIGLVTTYDSNVYRTETVPEGDLVQTIDPRVRWVYPGSSTYFLFQGHYQLRKYFGLGTEEGDEVGHRDLDVYDNFAIGAELELNRRGRAVPRVDLRLQERATALDSAEWPTLTDSNMHQLTFSGDLTAAFKPGSALSITPGFEYVLADYRVGSTGTRERWATGHNVYGKVEAEWRFLPKTSLLLRFEAGALAWSYVPKDNDTLSELIEQASQVDPAALQLVDLDLWDSGHWDLWFGLQGRFSRRLAVQALFGYANVYFPEDPDRDEPGRELTGADGILGRIQVHAKPVDSQLFSVGFVRDYTHSYFSNYYVANSPYFRYQGVFVDRVDARAGFAYAFREIKGDVARVDHQVDVNAGVGFRVQDWFEPWIEYHLLSVPKSSDAAMTFTTHMVQLRLELGF